MDSFCPPAESSTRKRYRFRMPSQPVYKAIGFNYIPTRPLKMPSTTTCRHCRAIKFPFETPSSCCCNGAVRLAPIEPCAEIIDLFTRDDELGIHFKQHARIYNNFFAFSSIGGNINACTEKGIHTFTLHGQLYHFIPNLLLTDNNPKYLQMYFYDGASEFDTRLNYFDNLRPEIIALLMVVMNANPYAQFFRSLRGINIQDNSKIRISKNPILDQRVFNVPTANDVAAILVDDSCSNQVNSPHILVLGKANDEHRIMHFYGCYDPLQYPLLFNKGDSGWHQGLKRFPINSTRNCDDIHFPISTCLVQNAADIVSRESTVVRKKPPREGKEVSCREYYAYRFQMRPNNYIMHTSRVLLQYIVDMYVKIENTRLDFLRRNQSVIRSELYQGVVDSVNDGTRDASSIGRHTILPASFIGGPRDMRCRYLNAMALVQHFGKPDLFLTMTCNPKWPEIIKELPPGEKQENRPDIVTRVFRSKLKYLKKLIVEEKIFGDVAARVDVIEFQKRGLPHAHLLIIMSSSNKILNPDKYDQYVSAELPSNETPFLRSLVIQHMLHGPCGTSNISSPCMKQKGFKTYCRFNYPKSYAEFTTCVDDCYPIYRRRDNGDKVVIRGKELYNRWVIPYNPYLLATYDCHINVEICSTVKAVKYIYKYVYKGHDRVCFNIANNHMNIQDEIGMFQSARWVGSPEAAWRIYAFDLYDIYPTVMPLQVHIPFMHPVRFNEHENLQNVVSDEKRQTTMLTSFFATNNEIGSQSKYLYSEFPQYYVWDGSKKQWNKRKTKRGAIGRMTFVNPCEGERYYLRLLLSHVKGPRSFDDLLTIDGIKCSTFKESAEKRTLVEQNDYAGLCMEEAARIQMPGTLQRLFSTLLIFCEHVNPQSLWETYYSALSEDFAHIYRDETAKIAHLTFIEIEKHLEGMGKNMKHYNLQPPKYVDTFTGRVTRDISDALNAPIPKSYVSAPKLLNPEQRNAYKWIMHHVKTNKPGAFFIDGPGGIGKTFLYCALYAKLRSLGKIVIPTATSGIAASNIPTGRTAHSRFKIPIDDNGALTCNVSKQSSLTCLLRETTLFIWDEASMAKKESIEALDLLLQDICDKKELFGGKIIVFGGDFRQVLPVLAHKTQQEATNSSLVCSYLWPQLIKFKLTTNIRAEEDPEFAQFLLQLGNGKCQTDESATIHLPSKIINCHHVDDECTELLVNNVYPEMNDKHFNSKNFSERAILTPTNDGVDNINASLIERFPGVSTTYKSIETIIDDNCNLYPNEFLNTLCPSGMSPHELVLKVGCPVILLRNLDPPNGLCNGTRLICKSFYRNLILCETSTSYYKGEQVLPRISLSPPSSSKYPFKFQRRQFPIKLCFAMTINNLQGQTLQHVCVFLKQPCFAHGQLYVGCSRAHKREALHVFIPKSSMLIGGRQLVNNVVSFENLMKAQIG